MKDCVVLATLEEHRFPEVAHDRHVGFQIHMRDVGEDRAEHGIGEGAGVERFDQERDVVAVADASTFRRSVMMRISSLHSKFVQLSASANAPVRPIRPGGKPID